MAVTVLSLDPLSALRFQAGQKIEAYFNAMAAASAHADMAAMLSIVRGAQTPHPIEERDRKMRSVAQAVLSATSADEINAIIAKLENGQV